MKNNKLAKILLILGGIMEIGIAIGHFIMPRFVLSSTEFSALPKIQLDFVILATIAVGLCLLIFGVLSLYFTGKITEKSTKIFALSQVALWSLRLTAEFIYPVKVPMFGITNMSPLIIIGVTAIIISYLLSAILSERNN